MISKWSCDTEDWSNDADHSVGSVAITEINTILQYIQIEHFI